MSFFFFFLKKFKVYIEKVLAKDGIAYDEIKIKVKLFRFLL